MRVVAEAEEYARRASGRVIRDHGQFRDVVPYHWGLFEQAEADGRKHGGAYLYNASLIPAEAVA